MALPFITVRTSSAAQTREVGRVLGESARPGDVMLLIGELGSGKTTFTQGLAEGLGVRVRATSPSYTLMHTYEGRFPVLHVDLLRCERPQDVVDLGLDEMLEAPWVVAIEWGEKAAPLLGDDYIEIEFEAPDEPEPGDHEGDEVRLLMVRPYGRFRHRMAQLTESIRAWAGGETV